MRITSWLFALTLAVGTTGCTLVGRPGPPSPPSASAVPATQEAAPETYGGQVDLQGQKLMLVLELSGRDESVDAVLRIAELGLTANGAGTRRNGALDLDLSYTGECAGTMKIQAHPGDGEGTLVGTLEATDCTGSEKGPVRMLRRSPDGLWQEAR